MFVVSKSMREISDCIFIIDNFVLVIRSTLLYTVQELDPSLVIQFVFCRAGFLEIYFKGNLLKTKLSQDGNVETTVDQWFVIYLNFTVFVRLIISSWMILDHFHSSCADVWIVLKLGRGFRLLPSVLYRTQTGFHFLTCFFFVRIYA